MAQRPVREARDGEEVNAGTIYLAPGGKHMLVARRDGIAVIALDDGALVNFCKPRSIRCFPRPPRSGDRRCWRWC